MNLSDALLILAAAILAWAFALSVWLRASRSRATWVCTLCAEEFGDRVFAEWHLHIAHHI